MAKKRVFIIHGWDGYPEEGWFPWLKAKLEKLDFLVQVPAMPNSAEPKIDAWVNKLVLRTIVWVIWIKWNLCGNLEVYDKHTNAI